MVITYVIGIREKNFPVRLGGVFCLNMEEILTMGKIPISNNTNCFPCSRRSMIIQLLHCKPMIKGEPITR